MTQAEQLILEALQASVSQDPTLLKEAELRFQEWALQPGFYAVLMVSWRCEGVHSVHWFALRVSHSFSPSCICACVRALHMHACVRVCCVCVRVSCVSIYMCICLHLLVCSLLPVFCAQRVLCNRSLQHDVRLMAVTQIKNGVELYWRRNTAKSAITH